MKKLFNQLMKLCEDPNGKAKFFYKDDVTGMQTPVRIFSYHIANYSDWILPGALECRGIMFEMNADKPVRIMSRPMEKFFNVDENPLSMNVKFEDAMFYMTKEDGSLISTFYDKGVLGLKSKTSIHSDQVNLAAQWLNGQPDLKEHLKELSSRGFTVNMEYVGPKNRIVLGYEEAALRILNARDNETGEYVDMYEIYDDAVLRPYIANIFDASVCSYDWVDEVRKMEGIEGYIIVLPNQMVKLKTDWYVALHHTKDSINNNRRLVDCCVENVTDDLRGLFVDDKMALTKIHDFETHYSEKLNEWFGRIINFIESNRHLDRKSYAIKGNTEFKDVRFLFGIVMNSYAGWSQEVVIEGIHEAMKKNYELLVPASYK